MNQLKNILLQYIRLVSIVFMVVISIRVFEYIYITWYQISAINMRFLGGYAINFDAFAVTLYSLFIFPLFIAFSYLSNRFATIFFKTLSFGFILFNLAVTHFFLSTNTLLTAELLDMQLSNIFVTIAAEWSYNKITIWFIHAIIITITLLLFIYFKIKNKYITYVLTAVYIVLSVVVIKNISHYKKSIKYFDTQYAYCYANAKIIIFAESVYFSIKQKRALSKTNYADYQNSVTRWQSVTNKKYLSTEYPFLHNNNTENVLGKYFPHAQQKPNIVIVISESLSRLYCGNDARYKNMMTFTDSLIQQSLYWQHFLSNAERSYGALPSILASLPYGTSTKGILNMSYNYEQNRKYPQQINLIHWLKENGYMSYFFYGGWGYFDNVGYYLKENGIDVFIDDSKFDTTKYQKQSETATSWGYNDKQLFRQSFDILQHHPNNKPYLSIYATLTLHSPFDLITTEYTDKEYIQRRLQAQHAAITNVERDFDFIASLLFVDDALRMFFEQYKKRDDYNNTIFIVVGDHGLPFGTNNVFEQFYVPLCIYSPMLTQPDCFKGISSHIDILPTMHALLANNFGLSKIPVTHWQGTALDTSRYTFNKQKTFHLALFKEQIPCFLYRNYFVLNNSVYRYDDFFNASAVNQPDTTRMILQLFDDYKKINDFACKNDKIMNR